MLTISAFKALRLTRKIQRTTIALSTGIKLPRLRDLEQNKAEPWFDEARAIAHLFGVTIYDLILPGNVTTFDDDPRFYTTDLRLWREGLRLPLSIAMRLQRRFGLTDIEDLEPSPIMRQMWAVLSASERVAGASGHCPWCCADIIGGAEHTAYCLPHNVLGLRGTHPATTGTLDAPRPAQGGRRGSGAHVHGLRSLRIAKGLTQAQMAAHIDVVPNHYSRIERCVAPLVIAKADLLCHIFDVSRERLFTAPADPVEEALAGAESVEEPT